MLLKGEVGCLRFAGFGAADEASLKTYFGNQYSLTLAAKKVSSHGWSWGSWDLSETHGLRLLTGDSIGLEMPVEDIAQVTAQGKNEVILTLQHDSADTDALQDVRLVVPGSIGDISACEHLKAELQRLASSAPGQVGGGETVVARVENVSVVAPRGRHEFEFFDSVFKVRGKTQSYTVKYKSIKRLFLLDLEEEKQVLLAIGLEHPLRHGNQVHHWVVLGFMAAEDCRVDVSKEELLSTLGLTQGQETKKYHFVAKLLKQFADGPKVIAPVAEFKEKTPGNMDAVKCTVKAQKSFIFFFAKSMMVVPKNVIWSTYKDLEGVFFLLDASLRRNTFDMKITTKDGKAHSLDQVDNKFFECIYDWFVQAGVGILNDKDASLARERGFGSKRERHRTLGGGGADKDLSGVDDGDDEENDQDFESAESDPEPEDESESEKPKRKRQKRATRK